MKIYHSIHEFTPLEKAVATTGTFDGVHVGHQRILSRLTETAEKIGGESVLLTFHPHPRMVLHPDLDLKLLTPIEEKAEWLEKFGLDHLIIHPFTTEFSRTSSLEFVRNYLVNQIGVKKLVIGYDHHFGRNREGSFDHLVEFGPVYGFEVEEIPAQDIDDIKVSSTKIRKSIEAGDIPTAVSYLNHDFVVRGAVVKGEGIGRTLDFPTANIQIPNIHKMIPADGVYPVRATLTRTGQTVLGMCNIGNRPTVSGRDKTIEVHLFDFESDIYGETVELSFEKRIRTEQKFESVDALKTQLQKDEIACRQLLNA